ncbi:MAG: class I SAM-dependent methyltransferase [Planctomycetes bacterium]|nr:class I SAM-dependent methyltransferase [Planctomycetota bacterium]
MNRYTHGMFTPRIAALIDELDELAKTRTDALQVPRAEGELLHQIALTSRCKLIVEVGTSYGFSGLFWGAALRRTGGRLHTIDISLMKRDSAQKTFARADISDLVVCHLGDARSVLATIDGPIDLAFLDADKESTRAYLDLSWPKLAVGGSVITDNAVSHRSELADFVRHVRSMPDATSVEVAVGNGIEWTVKVR